MFISIWIDPPAQSTGSGLNYTVDLAKRFYQQGYAIYLSVHISDWWSDPENQPPPKSWPKDLAGNTAATRKYFRETLVAFKDAGVELAIVSLGNEITRGLHWPLGRVSVDVEPESARIANFTNLASMLSSARQGVDDAVKLGVKKPEVLLHLSHGWNYTLQSRFYETLTRTGKFSANQWDAFGISFYPYNGNNATWSNLRRSLTTLARQYSKPVHVVETDYPFTCPRLNNTSDRAALGLGGEGQTEFIKRVKNVVRGVPNGLGRGVWYWEPAYVSNIALGSQCDDLVLFSIDNTNSTSPVSYSRSSVDMYLD